MKDLDADLQDKRVEVIDLARKLVQYPTVLKPPNGNEGECQAFVADWLGTFCDEVDVFELPEVTGFLEHPAHWKYSEYEGRPDVVGILKGSGSGRSLLFNGHVDVVPEDPLPWNHPPFAAEVDNGRIFGRGAADCKGGLAACMMAAKMIKASGIRLRGDVIIQSVVGEEYAGANGTLAAVLRGYTADAGISVEPSGLELGTSTRCGRLYEMKVTRGDTLFMASGQEYNPAFLISHLVAGMEAFHQLRNHLKPDDPIYHDYPNPQPASVVKINAGQTEPGGLIGVPKEAWLHAWIYGMPGDKEEDLDRELRAFFNDWIEEDDLLRQSFVEINQHTRFLEGSVVPIDHPLVGIAAEEFKAVTGKDVSVGPTSVTGDLGILDHWGNTTTITLGPRGGNLHDSDEFVVIQDLLDLVSIYARIMVAWCGVEKGYKNGKPISR